MNSQRSLWRRYRASKQAHIWNVLAILLVFSGLSPLAAPRAVVAAPQASNPIKHIVIMVKENRTFDDLFGTFPGADGATTYKDPHGKVHPLNHQPDHLERLAYHDRREPQHLPDLHGDGPGREADVAGTDYHRGEHSRSGWRHLQP